VTSYPGGGNTWTDLSLEGNIASLVGGVSYSSTNGGNLLFDGSTGYANAGNNSNLDISGAITMDAWIKVSTVASIQEILVKANSAGSIGLSSYGIDVNSGGSIIGILYSPSVGDIYTTASQYIYTGNWYNVVLTWDGSTNTSNNVNINVNNVLAQSFTKSDTLDSNTQVMTIGAIQSAGNPLHGNIGAVKIYNRTLTSNEIQQNFNALRGRYGL
jgi:hypothetical protein